MRATHPCTIGDVPKKMAIHPRMKTALVVPKLWLQPFDQSAVLYVRCCARIVPRAMMVNCIVAEVELPFSKIVKTNTTGSGRWFRWHTENGKPLNTLLLTSYWYGERRCHESDRKWKITNENVRNTSATEQVITEIFYTKFLSTSQWFSSLLQKVTEPTPIWNRLAWLPDCASRNLRAAPMLDRIHSAHPS